MGVSLRTILIIPFVLQIFGITALVGYLSLRSGKKAVEEMAYRLIETTSEQVVNELDSYLSQARQVNQRNVAALRSGAISLDDLDALHRYLILQHLETPEITSVLVGTPEGDFRVSHRVDQDQTEFTLLAPEDIPIEASRSMPRDPDQLGVYAVDEAGNLTREVFVIPNFDVRNRPWYQDAVNRGKPGWSELFQIGKTNLLAISGYVPVYDMNNRLEAVFSANLSISQLNSFLSKLNFARAGEVFIMEDNGLLVAHSSTLLSYDFFKNPNDVRTRGFYFDRVQATESSVPLIREAAQQLKAEAGSYDNILNTRKFSFQAEGPNGNERQFLNVVPFQDEYGLDWLVVTVVPESVFIVDIRANTQRTIVLSGLALLGAIAFGLWIFGQVMQPLDQLNQATQNYASGHIPDPLSPSRIYEIDSLRQTFEQMVIDLEAQKNEVAELHAQYMRSLEQALNETTAALNALQISRRKYQRLVDNIGDKFVIFSHTGPEGKLTLVSGGVEAIFGRTSDQVLGKSWQDITEWVSEDQALGEYNALKLAEEPIKFQQFEMRFQHPSGEQRTLLVSQHPVRNDAGDTVAIEGIVEDISDRKQAEAQFRQEAAFRGAIEASIVEGIAIITMDGKQTYVNPAFCRMVDWQADDLIGKTAPFVYWPPEEVDSIFSVFQRCINGEDATQGIEVRLVRRNGDRFDALLLVAPLRDDTGQSTAMLASVYDITDRKRIERALLSSEQKFATIFHANPAPAWIATLSEGRYQDVNTSFCRFIGVEYDALIGKTIEDTQLWYHEADKRAFLRYLTTQGKINNFETVFRNSAQEARTILLSATVQTINGEACIIGTLKDISDRKRAELALRENESMLRQITENLPLFFGLRPREQASWLYINPAFETITGYPVQAAYDDPDIWQKLVHPEDSAKLKHPPFIKEKLPARERTFRICPADGDTIWIRMVEFPVYDAQGESYRVAVFGEDVTSRIEAQRELQRLNIQLRELAATDSLTQIANRRQFLTTLDIVWRHHQTQKLPLTLILLDVDHFKAFNDTYGHPAGDSCLQQLAALLKNCMRRSTDMVARYGGEEFVILLPSTHREEAEVIIKRIQEAIAQLKIPHQSSPTAAFVTASLGAVVVNMPTAIDPKKAISKADGMLYQAKQKRNTYYIEEAMACSAEPVTGL